MNSHFSTIFDLIRLNKTINTKLNRVCRCSGIENTRLYRYIQQCNIEDKEKLIEELIKSAQVFTKYFDKLPLIEIFKDIEVVLVKLDFKGIDIISKAKCEKLCSSEEFISKMNQLSLDVFYSDVFDDVIMNLIDRHIGDVKLTGLEYANAVINYFEKDKKSKIDKILQILDTNHLFIIYFIIVSLHSCILDRFKNEYTFEELSKQGNFNFDYISEFNEVVTGTPKSSESEIDQQALYMTAVLVNAIDEIMDENCSDEKMLLEIDKSKTLIDRYMKMYDADSLADYHLAKVFYYLK